MSVDKVLKWKCDTCGVIVEKTDYGLPAKWIYTHPAGKAVIHSCESCTREQKQKWKEYTELYK